jgi:hypothetical protein
MTLPGRDLPRAHAEGIADISERRKARRTRYTIIPLPRQSRIPLWDVCAELDSAVVRERHCSDWRAVERMEIWLLSKLCDSPVLT